MRFLSAKAQRSHIGSVRPVLLGAAFAAASVMLATSSEAQSDCNDVYVPQPEGCERANADIVVTMPAGENSERVNSAPGGDFSSTGFSISIDGEAVAGAPAPFNPERSADLAAHQDQVTLKYDGLDQRRILNVSTVDLRAAYQAGQSVVFRSSANYPRYITRAEIRVFDLGARGKPTVAVIPAAPNGEMAWNMPTTGSGKFAYVLRVYDEAGRFDETKPLALSRTARAFDTHDTTFDVVAAGEGKDRTRIRNIPIRGGRVTAAGYGVGSGTDVRVMGDPVPVDASGAFVTSRILPAGDHVVEIEVDGRRHLRDVYIPKSEWFRVGIVDLTFGKRFQDDLISADPDYKDTYIDGRLAFYAKGKTQAGFRITASVDSGEGPIEDVFNRLNEKDPRRVLQRLDPDDLYPTYGDDSSSFDDAPTSGRFYLRIEKDASRFTWGDFKADVTGSEFLRNTRGLYGAELRYVSPNVTESGSPRLAVSAYAAQTDTLPQRDILRGTGGSVYFLSRQDISAGTETIVVEAVDNVTGRVTDRRTLVEGTDYDIDYMQGVIILTSPLGSSVPGGGIIGDGSGTYDANLVAQYEYTPTSSSLEGAAVGGRVEFWASDQFRLGVTAMEENAGTADQTMIGADARFEFGERSFVEAEIAQTEGPGFGRTFSTDGGLTSTTVGAGAGTRARAYRFDGYVDFADMNWDRPGHFGFYYEHKESGFSTLTEDITEDQTLVGLTTEVDISYRLTFGLDLEDFEKAGGDHKKSGEARLTYAVNDRLDVTAAVEHIDQITLGTPTETGQRTDFGLRFDYRPNDDLLLYAFGQVTLDDTGGLGKNNRLGFGVDAQITEKLSFSGEVSDGSKGLGASLQLSYAPTADNEVYLGYTLDPTRSGAGYSLVGRDEGTLVFGGRFRHSETVSSYGENTLDMFGARQSLTRTYGVNYTPDSRWTFSGAVESGRVRDSINGDFDRDAFSFGLAYTSDNGTSARARIEYRTEDGAGTAQDRDTWAASAGYEYKVSEDWRLLANVDALFSDSDQSSFLDGEYVEASLGFAYRPIMHDRLNLLFRYTYLHDLPGVDQVTANGTTSGPLQKSHVLSFDGNYRLSPKFTIGAKYGLRKSSVAPRGTSTFTDATAHLGILRLDWHVVHKWDASGEARVLYTQETDIQETGAVLGIYRHVGNHAKIGVGYEWGKVSDNPTDLDYVGSGVFLNVVAKF